MIKFEAIILSGGKGTRVKKYTKKIPKCLIKINKLPFIHHQLNYLKKNDIKSVIISTGYKASKVDHYLKKNIDFIKYKTVRDGKKLLGSGGAIIKSLKYYYNRPRPVQVAKSYGLKFHDQPLDSAKTPSYPSGHSAQGYLIAYVLGDIYPEYKMRFLKIAEEISYSRNIAKQHFLSDSMFGKKLALELWRYHETKRNS